MRVFNFKRARFILAIGLAVLVSGSTSFAATNGAEFLKMGEALWEIAPSAPYSAATLFVLANTSSSQRRLILRKLSEDGSAEALNTLAEIAAQSEDAETAGTALDLLLRARPISAKGLRKVADLSNFENRRREARIALAGIDNRVTAPAARSFGSLDFKSFLSESQIHALQKWVSVPEDLGNGSRYWVQTWFLKKVLSLQNASDEERLSRFDFLLNEISIFLAKEPKILKIETDADLSAFKDSLVSRFAYLQDEMQFSKGLSESQPIRLEIAPAMREKVELFSQSFRSFDQPLEAIGKSFFFDALASPGFNGLILRARIKTLSEREKLANLRRISDRFDREYKSLQTVATRLIESKAIQFANPAEQRFFELMISHYFSTYTFEETANVMKAVFERPDHQSGNDLFHLMVMYAGPQMQKLLQVISRRPGLSPELQATFKKLEESGLPSPWEKIAANFREPPPLSHWISIDRQARVGSMAETYKAVIRTSSDHDITIAARTLKSDIRQRVEREVPRLVELGRVIDNDPILRIYNFPRVGPVMDDIMEMARHELDVAATIQSQKNGERIYTATKILKNGLTVHFKTAKTLTASHPDVVYSTWLQGEKFETFAKRDPDLAVQLAEATASHWIEHALFKERFFHADLHQGNLKISQSGPREYTIGLLDFGMVGELSVRERSTIIKLALAAARNTDAALIAKYLYELAEPGKSTISLDELKAEAKKYLVEDKGPLLLTMDVWLGWSLSKGLKLPKNITAFSRGIGAIDQLMLASGSKTYIAEMVKSVALQHKMELAPDLAIYVRDAVISKVSETARKWRPKEKSAASALTCQALFSP